MTSWEYHTYLFEPGEKMLPKLNELGLKGWEAIHFAAPSQRGTRVLFKRPIETPAGEPQQ